VIFRLVNKGKHDSGDERENGAGENDPFGVDVLRKSTGSNHNGASDDTKWQTEKKK